MSLRACLAEWAMVSRTHAYANKLWKHTSNMCHLVALARAYHWEMDPFCPVRAQHVLVVEPSA